MRFTALAQCPAPGAQRNGDAWRGVFQHGYCAEQKASPEREREGEQEYDRIDGDAVDAWQVVGSQLNDERHRGISNAESGHAPEEAEYNALSKQDPSDLRPARAESSPDGDFLLAPFRPDEHEVGNVGTSDQQNQTD